MTPVAQTIIAPASGAHAHAAIAVIRLSGFENLSEFQRFFSRDLSKISARTMTRASLLDGSKALDDICFCHFTAPASFTGENVLELYVHGNTLNVERVLTLFLRLESVRLAQPGEFSRRALQNKKLTLTQAEGLDLMLNAATPLALTQGLSLLNGELHESYLELYRLFLVHKGSLELLLDFHEDVGEQEARHKLKESWHHFFAKLSELHRRTSLNADELLTPEVVIAGLPNAGKSTFFNQILGRERAIVSARAGTTRDYVSESIKVSDVLYRLLDTAGIRESTDEIEAEGIGRSRKKLRQSFFSVLLVNPCESDVSELKKLLQHPFDIVFLTHGDHNGFHEGLKSLESQGVVLSGHTALDLTKPIDITEFFKKINKKYLERASLDPLLSHRQKLVISKSYASATQYQSQVLLAQDLGILSHELEILGHCLQELLGIVSPDEVLDHIFENFCIGK